VDSYRSTLEKIIDISPDRLAVFNYAHVPWLKKHQRLIPEEALPRPGERLRILEMVISSLTEAGYVYIGMDHFAKPEDELAVALKNYTLRRNFQGYSTHAALDIYAMGVSSISELQTVYAQNTKSIPEYKKKLDAGEIPTTLGCWLDDDDRLRRYVIHELMCNSRVLKSDVKSKFGVDFDSYFAESLEQLKPFVEDDLVSMHADRLQVHETGRLIVRNIAMPFDRYLKGDGDRVYSRTV
jgi:oxygen-independent coproporphyrinogen-3 oxidase